MTYSLAYDGNGATSGAAPSDSAQYQTGDAVIVLGNTGGLEKTGYAFSGWNTAADGSGTDYAQGASFTITGNATLYAQWTKQSGDADLRSLTLSGGVLSPSFSADTLQYSVSVANGISSVTVTAVTNDDTSTATVSVLDSTGKLVQGPLDLTNGEASDPLSLDVGRNTLKVEVSAQDGTEKTYTITVTRELANQPPPPTQPPYYPVTDISLDETELTFTEEDDAVELKAKILPSYATNQQVTWNSSDPDVATVDQDGTVTPKAPGTAVITVTSEDGKKTASCKVTVEARERPFIIETSEKEILVSPNRTASFRTFVVYPNGKRKEITWSRDAEYSSSSSLLTVKNGRIKAGKKEGEASVTISYQGEERKIPVNISKTLVKSLSVASKTVSLKKGEAQQLELNATMTDNQMKDVTKRAVWTSSNEKIAKVSDTGKVEAVGFGYTWIRANYGGSQLSVRLIVIKDKPDLKALTASSRTVRIGEGDSEQVTLTAVFEDGSKKDVTRDAEWISDNSRIAEVSEGTVTGIMAGNTTITANYDKKKVKVKVSILAAETMK
ncbi:Ig-like domain-containing protein [Brevibacillus choshinensis]|uniref:Ig-like domain-containing protein n=1 Tax=Brevibacillus choshinensis TaxID=54911 RepID=A0ABX7FX07_BRECH|nr:Ig-like domain-containing protein [Brevibacillus choshinensis]QRG70335.1 Ig-like domain-containing protein [Brevibacillus choshinensis]